MSEPKQPTTAELLVPSVKPPVPSVKQAADTEFIDIDQHIRQEWIGPRENDNANTRGLTTAAREAEQKGWTDMARKSGLALKPVFGTIYNNWVDGEVKQLRDGVDEDELASQTQKGAEEVRQQLAQSMGSREEAELWLSRTQAWVRSQPELNKVLGTHGLGSRPDVVLPLVDHVKRTWKKG